MPELPDVTVYIEHITRRTQGATLENVRLASPFVLRTFDPKLSATFGKKVLSVRRMGKRIVLGLEDDLFVVIHLMIAGRFRWGDKGAKIPGKLGLAAFDFEAGSERSEREGRQPPRSHPSGASGDEVSPRVSGARAPDARAGSERSGTLLLTEAGTKKRASLHVIRGEAGLAAFDRGGLEVLDADLASFRKALRKENHTLKRTLTDPRLFSGIGNAYSDEILHRAKLSPVQLTAKISDEDSAKLHKATREILIEWTDRLRAEAGDSFPEKVTAFRAEMAVHGKYGKPCPVCQSPVQRIAYADNETNYCARCQTGGRLLADRSLSRLLREDWPRTLEELEEIKAVKPS